MIARPWPFALRVSLGGRRPLEILIAVAVLVACGRGESSHQQRDGDDVEGRNQLSSEGRSRTDGGADDEDVEEDDDDHGAPDCSGHSVGTEQRLVELTECLLGPEIAREARPSEAAQPNVILYVDLSGSMRGYLDPQFASDSTYYRSILDRLTAEHTPVRGFGFGAAMRPVEPTLAALSESALYRDRATNMEAVFESVLTDQAHAFTHIILGDGRRDNAPQATQQFVRMREAATRWVAAGGTFIVAASMAPFRRPSGDPAACQASQGAASGRCPVYAFVFAASQQRDAVLQVLGRAFQNLYAWPLPALDARSAVLHAEQDAPPHVFESRWQTVSGVPIARSTAPNRTLRGTPVRLQVLAGAATANVVGRLLAAQRGSLMVEASRLTSASLDWVPTGEAGLVRLDDQSDLRVYSMGDHTAPVLLRVRWLARAQPAWLSEYDAPAAGDPVRTLGLGRLFEAFVQRQAQERRPAITLYVVAN